MTENGTSERQRSARWDLLRFVARISPGATAVLGLLTVLVAVIPALLAVAIGMLVGNVPDAAAGGTDSDAFGRCVRWLIVAGVLFLAQQSIVPLQEAISESLGVRATAGLGDRVMRASLQPAGIGHLEDPAMLDRIARARSLAPTDYAPLYAVPALSGIVTVSLSAVVAAVVLFGFSWWAPFLLLGARVLSRTFARRRLFQVSEAESGQGAALRRANYLRELAVTPGAAKELRVFGLSGWLTGRFNEAWNGAMSEVWGRRGRGASTFAAVLVPPMVADILVLTALAHAYLGQEISLPQFVTFAQIVVGMAGLSLMSTQDIYAEVGARPVPAVLELERAARELPGAGTGRSPGELAAAEITFEKVNFGYHDARKPVLRDLDLTVPAGGSLAIVGANGAGKTTLVKLLTRMYDPTGGTIRADGVDLRDLDVREWQRRISGVFQDFIHYDLCLRDNIVLGAPHLADDEETLQRVTRQAGVLPIVEMLPYGWDTVLNRLHSKGGDLSGGQWQRVAIARALFAVAGGARILILDEPTANLDVRAEADIYAEILELAGDVTTILISHRFATVRKADRICVVDDGRIVECGSHDQLMAREGRYARMFRVQAAAFEDPVQDDAATALDARTDASTDVVTAGKGSAA